MVSTARSGPGASSLALILPLVGVVGTLAGGWLVLEGEPVASGVALGVGASGLASAVLTRGGHGPRGVLVSSIADRMFDGIALGAIAWVERVDDPATAAGALVALGASFLSAYVRVRGASLGYDVEEALATRVIRYTLVIVGLLAGWVWWTIWVLAAFSALASAIRASQVAKEERA